MSRRSIGLYSTGGCAVIAAVCVLLNLVSSRVYFRLDCTENKIYSLSPATEKILSRLTDPFRIRVFFDENLPPEYDHQRRYLQELLQDMSSASRGRLRIDFADMKKPETRDDARRAGIAPLRFTAVRKDKFEVQEGMMGLVMYYEDKKEVLPAVTQIANIEYELAGRIVKLTQARRPVVGWTMGNGEMDPPGELSQYLSQNYELRRFDQLGSAGWGAEIPPMSALVVAGPRTPLTDTAIRSIDRAIMSGVPTALLLDLYDVNMGNFFVRKNASRLEKLLESYGLVPREGLVVDAQNIPVHIQSRQGFFTVQTLVNYPYIPRVTDLSKDHPVTRPLQEIALPFVTSLDIRETSGVTVLARSSSESFRIANPFLVSPTEQINVGGSDQGPFVLGAALQGRRRSAFSDTPSPGVPVEAEVRLVALANSNFLDESRGGNAANLSFAANLVDWLAASDDLISIRSKGQTFRPLEKVSDKKRNFIKAANLFLMPLLLALLGAVRWQIRRRRRGRWEGTL